MTMEEKVLNCISLSGKAKFYDKLRNAESPNKVFKCKCSCPRQFPRASFGSFFYRHCYKFLRSCGLFNNVFSYHTSTTGSLRFCLYGFIVWTLIISPMLCNFTKDSLLFRGQISLGGVLTARACHPGPTTGGGTRPPPTVNLVPFQRNEYIPKMSEQTIGASGPAEGPIHRNSPRYHDELSANWNPDIIFRDEEKTNEDRMMTKRCMDRLNVLAIWVAIQWPGHKLRVTEGWDDPDTERIHPENSLHYEGRAVDITTNDQDTEKYPILASLAVEAGFDWVYYEEGHVHCSVKSDSSEAALRGGCFPGNSMVQIPGGRMKKMEDLQPGDKVFSLDKNGEVSPDTLLTFMDVQTGVHGTATERAFVSITTEHGKNLRLTRNHLIHVATGTPTKISNSTQTLYKPSSAGAVFAGNIKVGQYVYVTPGLKSSDWSSTATTRQSKVTKVEIMTDTSGAYAPLTTRGSIVVDDTVASCYAVIENDNLAHIVMTPTRYYHLIRHWLKTLFETNDQARSNSSESSPIDSVRVKNEGISFYSKFLYSLGYNIFPDSMFWGD